MISPIGTLLQNFDTNITAAMNVGITGLTAYMATPVKAALALYYLVEGVKIAQGDGGPVQDFVTRLFKNVTILWFCSTAATYNTYVMNIFYTGIPTALNKAVFQNVPGGAAAGVSMANGVQGTGAQFDQIWAMQDQMVAMAWAHADFLDVGTKLAATLTSLTGGLILCATAMVYEMSRFILAIVLELGVVAIACLIFDVTKPIFERWVGKVIALVFLQVTVIVVLQIAMTADVQYMKQMVAAFNGTQGVPSEVQGLVGVVLMLFMGAFAVYSLPTIAYSIGTGVAINMNLPVLLAAMAAKNAAETLAGLAFPALPAAEAGGELALGLPQAELAGSATAAIAAPAPASLPPPLSLPGF